MSVTNFLPLSLIFENLFTCNFTKTMVNDRLEALKIALNENDGSHGISVNMGEEDELLPVFFSLVEELSSDLDKIDATIENMKKKHNSVLSAPSTDERIKQELENLMAEIKRLSSKVKRKLKVMSEDIELDEQNKTSSPSLRIKKTQHSALSRRFITAMSDYNTMQTEYRQKCKDRIKRQLQIMGDVKTDAEIEELLESGNVALFTRGIVVETQKTKQTLTDIEDRHADIIQLEQNIRELHDIFVDMASLVENQGDLVDSIEHNVQSTSDCIRRGIIELEKAETSQRAARKKIIILSILAAVVTIIILGIIIGVIMK